MKENEIMNKRSGKAWIFLWPDEKEKMYNSNVATGMVFNFFANPRLAST